MGRGEASDKAQRGGGRPANSWVFVLALGLLIGFVIGFVLLLSRLPVDPLLASHRTSEIVEAPDVAGNYDFYTVLSDERVVRPDAIRVERLPAQAPEGSVPIETARVVIRPATRVVPASAQRLDGRDPGGVERYREIPASTSAPGREAYYLQAGNFRQAEEAERARAVVLLLGLDAFVVVRRDSDGTTGHRVRIGPFVDAERLGEARRRLDGGDVSYDLIRVSG